VVAAVVAAAVMPTTMMTFTDRNYPSVHAHRLCFYTTDLCIVYVACTFLHLGFLSDV